jgi:hypothetical protein
VKGEQPGIDGVALDNLCRTQAGSEPDTQLCCIMGSSPDVGQRRRPRRSTCLSWAQRLPPAQAGGSQAMPGTPCMPMPMPGTPCIMPCMTGMFCTALHALHGLLHFRVGRARGRRNSPRPSARPRPRLARYRAGTRPGSRRKSRRASDASGTLAPRCGRGIIVPIDGREHDMSKNANSKVARRCCACCTATTRRSVIVGLQTTSRPLTSRARASSDQERCVRDVFVYSGGNATGTYKTHNTRKPARLTIL